MLQANLPLRVIIVATQISLPGRHGGTTHVGELVRNLQRHGDVLVLGQRGSTQPGVVGVGLKLRVGRRANQALAYAYLPRALSAARKFRPDVIYERGSSYGLGALLSERLGIPMLCMVLDEHYSNRSLRRASKIISTTESTVPARYRDKFVKVSWGANTERFHPDVPPINSPLLTPFAGKTLGYVGSFKGWHGLEDLVQAATRLRDRPVRFLMVGDGAGRADIEALVRAAGLSDRFIFVGSVAYEEVPSWISAMDICLAPFREQQHGASKSGFVLDPLKVFEYLAMGKPTITISSDNIRALLRHGEHAWLFDSGNVASLTGAIEHVIDDLPAATAMAERGRNLVLERHTWAAHASHLHRLFREMSRG